MIDINRAFGVHSDVKKSIKLFGPIYLLDVIIMAISFTLMSMGKRFFEDAASPIPYIIWSIACITLGIYSIMRPFSNPEKRNYQLFFMSFNKVPRFFKSIDISVFEPTSLNFNMHTSINKRMPVSKKYNNGKGER